MAKIFFQTHGCSTNFSESEVMMGILKKTAFDIVNDIKSADIIVINVCTVKGENTAIRKIKKIKNDFPDKKLIVAGCITQELLDVVRNISNNISFISTHNINRITDVVEEVLQDNIVQLLPKDEDEIKICLPKRRKNKIIGIVPILSGCNFNCSYCSVKLIKGKLLSYPIKSIVKEVYSCLSSGCKEIWITSQDNAAYMFEKSDLPYLLKRIVEINKDFFMRLGMMNPLNILPVLDDLIEIYKNKKMFKFLHAPVQSGNNDILKLMNRHYTINDFKKIINAFRKEIPEITISTDIIVGFPTESDEQFNDSLNLIKEIKPDILNLSRFIPRPHTKAAEMEQINGSVIKDRSRLMTDIFNNISRMRNERWLDWEGQIIIDERGKNNTWIGRNYCYKPVIVRGNFKLGDIIKVKINNTTTYDLRAECL